MLTAKVDKKENKFQKTLDYLAEYNGVKGAAVIDREGLVVCRNGDKEFEAEQYAPLALLILEQASKVLHRLQESPAQTLVIKTKSSWITIERIDSLILIVKAGADTDELLKVRINQGVDMIKSNLKENYPLIMR
jgi:predicted regulator of Ras-like GTPase activity (Roadblock/LC7/MglB family)